MDVPHESFFILAFAVMAADGSVHDPDPHALAEINRFETILQPILRGEVRVAAEAEGSQPEPIHLPMNLVDRPGLGFERDMLCPAAHCAQLDEFVTRRGDALEGFLKAVSMVAVGMPS